MLLALVDTYWRSSTWKAIEVSWACEGIGFSGTAENHRPVPVFIWFLDDTDLDLGYFGLADLVVLPQDPRVATTVIVDALGAK